MRMIKLSTQTSQQLGVGGALSRPLPPFSSQKSRVRGRTKTMPSVGCSRPEQNKTQTSPMDRLGSLPFHRTDPSLVVLSHHLLFTTHTKAHGLARSNVVAANADHFLGVFKWQLAPTHNPDSRRWWNASNSCLHPYPWKNSEHEPFVDGLCCWKWCSKWHFHYVKETPFTLINWLNYKLAWF